MTPHFALILTVVRLHIIIIVYLQTVINLMFHRCM